MLIRNKEQGWEMNLTALTERHVRTFLQGANSQINGPRSWDPQIISDRVYYKLLTDFELASGETYVAGDWDSKRLDEFIYQIQRAIVEQRVKFTPLFILSQLRSCMRTFLATAFNHQSKSRAFVVGKVAYDVGNDFFEKILDKRMNYTCGYWDNANTLDEAQENKLALICKKLQLQPGQKILDIGCGFGGFARYAAEKHQVEVTGVTISKEQYQFAQAYCKGLPISILMQDYRDIKGTYDHIVSIGMFEHVGARNYRAYMKIVHQCLADDGLFLLHTIGNNYSVKRTSAWVNRYIFPNGMLPSIAQIGRAAEKYLVMEDWHNLGVHYDKTLMAWYYNLVDQWESIKLTKDEQFFRLWSYYLLSSAGGFRARDMQLWQIVFSKFGLKNGYRSVR
jgi:cyclopropane-fatty-acyl-phospholipid synthase